MSSRNEMNPKKPPLKSKRRGKRAGDDSLSIDLTQIIKFRYKKYRFHHKQPLQKLFIMIHQFIFHIGMHKCASSTLQEDVFRYEPDYIGTYKELAFDKNFAKQFEQLSPIGGRQFGSIKGVSEWVERVNNYHKEDNHDLRRYILSSEFLCQSNKLSNRPIVKFLNEINQKIFDGNSIKVIIVFRNQAEMMASEYAQNSNIKYNASQKDFENWVSRKLTHVNNSILDWGEWAKCLINTFGKENVCILLLEEIQTLDFWEKLVSFIDARVLNAENLHQHSAKKSKNKRKIDDKTWGLRPFDLKKKANVDVRKIKYFLSSIGLKGNIIENITTYSIDLRVKYLSLLKYQDHRLMASDIRLNSEIEKKIRDHYRESNYILSKILGKNIHKLGY